MSTSDNSKEDYMRDGGPAYRQFIEDFYASAIAEALRTGKPLSLAKVEPQPKKRPMKNPTGRTLEPREQEILQRIQPKRRRSRKDGLL